MGHRTEQLKAKGKAAPRVAHEMTQKTIPVMDTHRTQLDCLRRPSSPLEQQTRMHPTIKAPGEQAGC